MIPLVALDLDGTVIGSDGQVQACVWEAIEDAKQAGIKLIVCTGRPCGGVAQKVAQRIGPNNPHIFQSGALVAYPDGKVLQVYSLKEANTRRLIEHAREHNFVLELYTPNALFVERKTPLGEAHAKMIGVNAIVRDLLDVASSEPVVRAQWVVRPSDMAAVTSLELDDVHLSNATSPALSDTFFVSVTRKSVSKGSAIRLVAEVMKIELENIMGVGDSSGDVPMLELVGHPVVMANAPATIKRKFDVVAGDVDRCGVVAALKEALELQAV